MRIGAAVNPVEGIVHVRVHHTNRGAPARPVLYVAMRADPGHAVKSGGPAPYHESVASHTQGGPRGPLHREGALRTEGDGAVVEEIVGRHVRCGRVELDRLRQAWSRAVRSVERGGVVEGQHRVPAQLVIDAELQIL